MMKDRLEEFACAVVGLLAAICEWLKYKNQGNNKKGRQKFWGMKRD